MIQTRAAGLVGWLVLVSFTVQGQWFEDRSTEWNIDTQTEGEWGAGVAAVDYDLDGHVDLITLADGDPAQVHHNVDASYFETVVTQWVSEHTKMITFPDIDNDGDLDVFITQNNAPNALYRNDAGVYTEITATSGIVVEDDPSHGHSWGDINNDGYLDLYVCNYFTSNILERENQLYLNDGDNTFTNITETAGVGDGFKASFQSLFVDYDRDGDQDLFVLNDRTVMENTLYRNDGNEVFTNVSFETGMGDYIWSMSGTVGDYNADGWFDIYVCNNADGNLMKSWNPETEMFDNTAADLGVEVNAFCWGSQFLDFDNDSDEDLFVQSEIFEVWNSYGNNFLFEMVDGTYIPTGQEGIQDLETESFSSAVADFNGDGALDLFSHAYAPEGSSLWMNEGTPGGYLNVNLEGVTSNRMGVGSFIEIWYDEVYAMQYVLCGEAYLNQLPYTEHFGVGEEYRIDSLQVTWLSGIVDTFYDVPTSQTIHIAEGSSTPPILVNGNLPICPGMAVSLSVQGLTSVDWSNGASGNVLNATEPGVYYADGLNEFGARVVTETVTVDLAQQADWNVEILPPLCYPDSTASLQLTGPDADLADFADSWYSPDEVPVEATIWQVADPNGCLYSGAVEFTVPEAFGIAADIDSIQCSGDLNGAILFTGFGGTLPYDTPGGEHLEALGPGSYSADLTDANGCTTSVTVELLDPPPLILDASDVALLCAGDNDGLITANATGGTGSHTFALPEENGSLSAGFYSVYVSDANGCIDEIQIEVTEPAALLLTVDDSNIGSDGTGALVISTSGGTGTIETLVNGSLCPEPCEVEPGNYVVTATDENGCSATEDFVITHIATTSSSNAIVLYPNPAFNTLHFTGASVGGRLQVMDAQGGLVLDEFLQSNSGSVDVTQWAAGVYTAHIVSGQHGQWIRFVVQH